MSISQHHEPHRRGIIFILSAPSGAGKTTLWRRALTAIDELDLSVSLTTRGPRGGEVEGVDHHFVSEEEFKARWARGELAEHARHFGASYGTPRGPLDRAVREGRDILLEIDISGAKQIREKYPRDAVGIFVLPPSFEDLEERLRHRGTEDEPGIQRRLIRAREEAREWTAYDFLIINAEVDRSIAQLQAIVLAERLRAARQREGFAPWKS